MRQRPRAEPANRRALGGLDPHRADPLRGPLWLWGVPLRWFFLKSDDFVYLARSRTPAALRGHLATPHHGHVAPLFLLETHLLARLAGTLEALPAVLGWASYATLVLAMAATGHVVARESGRMARGLAAMAAVGLASVLGPTLLWYAAGQALAAGTAILVMLAALQAWRIRGGWWRLGRGLLAATAAPLFWSAGYAAGPVGMAYLWADGRRACRRAAAILAASSLAVVALVWCVAGRGSPRPRTSPPGRSAACWPLAPWWRIRPRRSARPWSSITWASTPPPRPARPSSSPRCSPASGPGRGDGSGAAGSRTWPRINPLEAAGAVLVIATFGLIFAARGTESDFDSLRGLGWYDAMAELGAVLFVAGWCAGALPSPPPAVDRAARAPRAPGRRALRRRRCSPCRLPAPIA